MGVRETVLVVRLNNLASSSASSALICLDTAGCVICSSLAALAKFRFSAT